MNDEFNYRQNFYQYSKEYADQLTFDAKKTTEELLGYLIESDTLIDYSCIPQEYIDAYYMKQKMKLL